MGTGEGPLLPVLSPTAALVGVERDPRWVAKAREVATQQGFSDRCRFVEGVAEALPCPDQSFDLVTCQTLLIHVADPAAVIAEMQRVVAPGGTVLLSEPNNLVGMLLADSATADMAVAELVEGVAFALICERGKAAVGEGNSSVGDLLPGMLAEAGLSDIRSMLNDKAFALVPPYEPDDQRALRTVMIDNADIDHWIWSREDARRYFLAGGGHEPEFQPRWQRRLDEARRTAQELAAGRLHTAGGGIHYLISGRTR